MKNIMNKKILSILIIVVFVVVFSVLNKKEGFYFGKSSGSFEECVKAGNAVMESYPRQCRDGKSGELFVENIGNELEKVDLIRLDNPRPNQKIESPLLVKGSAMGNWFFEGDFPIILTNWDGLIIAEGFATAKGEWMTKDFVEFEGVVEFENPDISVSNKGTLILQKDNPSDISELDDALEIPVVF
ncbi:Gmad2 immunoglobulin-like domain-containing protein [Patescibacteria group bacterium]